MTAAVAHMHHRNRLIRTVHARARQLGIDDDLRREMQRNVTGKASMKEMSASEIRAVLDAMSGRCRASRADLPNGPHTAKLRALWLSGYWLGVIHSREDAALGAWIRRQTGRGAARWVAPAETAQCIEALKDWLAREAGVVWPRKHADTRARVLEAQWRRLHALEVAMSADRGALAGWVERHRGEPGDYAFLDGPVQDDLIRALGQWLRGALRRQAQ